MDTSRERTARGTRYLPFLLAHPRFLAFGFMMTLCSGFGQTFFLSTFGGSIRKEFDLDEGQWGMYYGIATAASAFAVMVIGRRIDDLDLSTWTTRVLLGLALSCLAMGWSPFAGFLIFGLFCMRFAGQGLMGHTASTSMARYFEAERGRALTISGLGFALGFAVFPPLGLWLQQVLPWRQAWFVLGGVALCVLLPGVRLLLRGHALRHEGWLARTAAREHAAEDAAGATRERHWTRGEVVRDARFFLLLPGVMACPLVMTGMIFFHDALADAKGWTPEHLAASMTALGVALYTTSLVLGPLVDRVGAPRVVPFTLLPLILGLLAAAFIEHPLAAPLYLACAGMTMGSMGPAIGSLWPSLYGTRHLGSIRALATACMALSTAAGTWVFGHLMTLGADMAQIAWGSAVYSALGCVLLFWALRRDR